MKNFINDRVDEDMMGFDSMFRHEMGTAVSSIFTSSVLTTLKCDLAVREDNKHIGSQLGGNQSQLLFLLTRPVTSEFSNQQSLGFTTDANDNLVLLVPKSQNDNYHNLKTQNLVDLRNSLESVYNTHPDRKDITKTDLLDLNFLETQKQTVDIKFLVQAIITANSILKLLDSRSSITTHAHNSLKGEIIEYQKLFLKEMGLPPDALDHKNKTISDEDFELIRDAFDAHPIWGAKALDIENTVSNMTTALMTKDLTEKLTSLSVFPAYISLLVTRFVITSQYIVQFNLDESLIWIKKVSDVLERVNNAGKVDDEDDDDEDDDDEDEDE